jgi:hypothetical protein
LPVGECGVAGGASGVCARLQAMRPSANLRGHLTFHLKHEVPHLEMLSRLFDRVDTAELVDWIEGEPSDLSNKSITTQIENVIWNIAQYDYASWNQGATNLSLSPLHSQI